MKIKYCKKLSEHINFDAPCIYTCCSYQMGPKFLLPTENTNLVEYYKNFAEWKIDIAKNSLIGENPKACGNCIELEEKEISLTEYIKNKFFFNKNSAKVKHIIFKAFKQCELSCVYCVERYYTKGKQTKTIQKSDYYDTMPFFLALKEHNLIDKDFCAEFQGGSIQVWDEFVPILKEVVNLGVKKLLYHSNAYSFVPEIAEHAHIPSYISISIDAGCTETYAKIKGEDNFSQVIDNITKYAEAGVNCTIKYIIIKNLNDNISEMEKFIETIEGIKSKIKDPSKINLMVTIDYRESLKPDYQIPESYRELIKLLQNYCQTNNTYLDMECFIKEAIEKDVLI